MEVGVDGTFPGGGIVGKIDSVWGKRKVYSTEHDQLSMLGFNAKLKTTE